MFKMCLQPLLNHLVMKREMYKEKGMTKEEIKKDLVSLLLSNFMYDTRIVDG